MAQRKTITLWNKEGDHVVVNEPVKPPRSPQITEEHAIVIAYNEDMENVSLWKEKGFKFDKDPKEKAAAKTAKEEEKAAESK